MEPPAQAERRRLASPLLAVLPRAILGTCRRNTHRNPRHDRRPADRLENLPGTAERFLDLPLALFSRCALLRCREQPVGFACRGLRPLPRRLGGLHRGFLEPLPAGSGAHRARRRDVDARVAQPAEQGGQGARAIVTFDQEYGLRL